MTTYTMLFENHELLDNLVKSAKQAGFHTRGFKSSLLRNGGSITIVSADNTPISTITRVGDNLVMATVGEPNSALQGLIDQFMQAHPGIIQISDIASDRQPALQQGQIIPPQPIREQSPTITPQRVLASSVSRDLSTIRPRRSEDSSNLFPTSAELARLFPPDLRSHVTERTLTSRQWQQVRDHFTSRRFDINTYGHISRPVDGVTIGTVTFGRNEFGAETFHLQLFPGLSNVLQAIDQLLGRTSFPIEEQRKETRR